MFKPIGNYCLIQPVEIPDTTPSGLVLPESSKERPNQGKVVAVGNGQWGNNDERLPISVKVNDTVFFNKFSGMEIKLEGKKYLLIRDMDLLGYVE